MATKSPSRFQIEIISSLRFQHIWICRVYACSAERNGVRKIQPWRRLHGSFALCFGFDNSIDNNFDLNLFQFVGKRGRESQSAMHDFDKLSGVVFYSQVGINGVACWNSAKPFTKENHAIIARDDRKMIYPSDLNVKWNGALERIANNNFGDCSQVDSEGTIWMMTNSMPLFIYARLDPNEYNFRIWRQRVPDAIEGTACEAGRF